MAVVIGANQAAESAYERGLLEATPHADDAELVAAVRGGSDRAFEELYGRYRPQIRGFVLGLLRDPARADDVTQEVFLSALRRMRATDSQIMLRPWLYEIARNASIDDIRRQRRRFQEVPLEAEGPDLIVPALTPPAPESVMETKQRLSDLTGAFRGLSQPQHRVIVLRELEGLSYEQIGRRMGMPRSAVESTLFRARRRLGAEYRELASGRRCAQVQTLIEGGSERPLLTLGVRERRHVSRHLAHCQPCRRVARLAGVDERFFQPSRVTKLGLLLPLPWLPLRRASSSGSLAGRAGQRLRLAAQPAQTLAPVADPSAWSLLGHAATAGAAVLIALAGGGFGGAPGTRAAPGARAVAAVAPPPAAVVGHALAARLPSPLIARPAMIAPPGSGSLRFALSRGGGTDLSGAGRAVSGAGRGGRSSILGTLPVVAAGHQGGSGGTAGHGVLPVVGGSGGAVPVPRLGNLAPPSGVTSTTTHTVTSVSDQAGNVVQRVAPSQPLLPVPPVGAGPSSPGQGASQTGSQSGGSSGSGSQAAPGSAGQPQTLQNSPN